MAYVRFSSDDFQSTVYLYYSVNECYTLHIANHLLTLTDRQKEFLGPPVRLQDYESTDNFYDDYLDRRVRLQNILSTSNPRSPFDHPLAGKTLNFDEPGAAADALEELKAGGAHIPDGVVETLREEQAELDNE